MLGAKVDHIRDLLSQLEESNRRAQMYQRLFDDSATLAAIIDFRGAFRTMSPGWRRTFGYVADDLVDRTFDDFVHPDDVEHTLEAAARLADPSEDTVAFENRYRKKDGAYLHLAWSAVGSLRDQRIYAVAVDITPVREAAAEIAKQRDVLRRTGSMAKVGGWEWDAETNIIAWSPQVAEIHETSEAQATLDEYTRRFPASSRIIIRDAFRAASDEAASWDTHVSFCAADGTARWIRLQGMPLFDAGRVVGVVGTTQDITTQKRAELELARSERVLQQLHSIVASSDLAFAEKTVSVLGLAMQSWGFDGALATEVQGDQETISGASGAGIRISDLSALKGRGIEVPIEARSVVVGRLVLWREDGTQPEISPRDRQLLTVLARWIGYEREQQRARDEAEEANARARAASATKSAFLATMSHEIRTPLNGVLGMAQLLLDTPLSEDQRGFVTTLRASGDALLALINDLLDFSKIEAGKLELSRETFELEQTVTDVVDLLYGRAFEKRLEVVVELPSHLPDVVYGDSGRIRQILLNFLSNAIKFTSEGHVLVHLEVDRRAEPTRLKIAVHDTGIGIDATVSEKLFQPFTQADASTTRRFGGTGLGLAVCQQLARLMGGDVGLRSRPGLGSEFWVTLPLEAVWGLAVRAQRQTRTAILVERHCQVRRVLEQELSRLGYDVQARPDVTWKTDEPTAQQFWVIGVDKDEEATEQLRDTLTRLSSGGALVLLTHAPGWQPQCAALRELPRLPRPIKRKALAEACEALASNRSWPVASRRSAADNSAPEPIGERTRVLVVEDNAVNQRVATRMLERLGCAVDVAGDGLEAVRMIEQADYDVVFMDCQMPTLDGYEATRRIREREQTLGLARSRIVALTANAMLDDRTRCVEAGMDDFLAKPVKFDELRRALTQAADTATSSAKRDAG